MPAITTDIFIQRARATQWGQNYRHASVVLNGKINAL